MLMSKEPTHHHYEKMRIAFVIPCYNEGLSISHLLNEIDKYFSSLIPDNQLAYILVDDGSVDNTWACILSCKLVLPIK